jgi:regulator of cell morphogenesis and NO signaling
MNGAIDNRSSLGALVAERPERIRLFEQLRLDYCCGGSRSLAEACEGRGLDAATVRVLIEATDEARGADEREAVDSDEGRDWRQAGVGELCDHIVSVHHARLREELPQLTELLATVVRVHGEGRPELARAERAFAALRAELEPHLTEEERSLFPACERLERLGRDGGALDLDEVDRHQAEHAGVGRRLAELRELAGGYEESRALCSTHRATLRALRDLEADLHRHVHEENNVLFARVRELAAGAAAPAGEKGDGDAR